MEKIKRIEFEKHPLCVCIAYVLCLFAALMIIDNNFYAVCAVDVLFYVFIYIRRKAVSQIKHIYTVSVWIMCFLTVACLILTAYCWSRWYMIAVADASSVSYMSSLSNNNIVMYLFMISVAAPLCEESIFRYAVLNGFLHTFEKCSNPVKYACAILFSSLLFAAMHGTGVHLIIGFLCGIGFGLAYCTTGKLHMAIAMHMLYNIGTLFVKIPYSLWLCAVLTTISSILIFICIYNVSCRELNIPDINQNNS